jgi:hypothetical protein
VAGSEDRRTLRATDIDANEGVWRLVGKGGVSARLAPPGPVPVGLVFQWFMPPPFPFLVTSWFPWLFPSWLHHGSHVALPPRCMPFILRL